MDVNLLWAVLWAEWQRHRSGKQTLAVILVLALLPSTVLTVYLGREFAQALPGLDTQTVGSGIAIALLALALLAAIWDGTPALALRPLRPFLVRPAALFAAEILLSLLTPFRLAQATLLVAFTLGAGAVRSALFLWLPPFAFLLLLCLIGLERLLGRLTRLAGQHLRLALVFLALLPLLRGMINGMALETLKQPLLQDSLRLQTLHLPAWLPTCSSVAGWQAIWGWRQVWASVLEPTLWTTALLALTFLALRRELSGEESSSIGKTGALWRFRRPWAGVAHHRWKSLWTCKQGRLFVFLPLLVPLLQVDALIIAQRPAPSFLIACVGWVMLPLGGLACSLFGLDRKAVRTFWTWPLEDRDLLLGKILGTAAYQTVVILLFFVVLPLTTPMPLHHFPSALLFCIALASFQLQAGLRHSLEHPRPLDPKGLNPGDLGDEHLIKLGRLLLPWLFMICAWLGGSFLGGRVLLGLMLFAACLGFLSLSRALPKAEVRLMRLRDHLSAGVSTE